MKGQAKAKVSIKLPLETALAVVALYMKER